MKNSVTCPQCNSENPFYNAICTNCNSYIRERVVNLDLWKTLGLIVESPTSAFKLIVFSEHKNFIIFIILFASVKLMIDARFLSMITLGSFRSTVGIGVSYLIIIASIFILILLFSIIFQKVSKPAGIETRVKDYFALMSYMLTPFALGIIVLFPFELIIFGDYLFSINPSPFIIKEFFAYLFLVLEIFIILWSIFLGIKAFNVQTRNRIYSFSFALIFNFTLWILLFFSSKIIFTI